MATWEQIGQWSADGVAPVGDALAVARKRVADLQDELDHSAVAPGQWSGGAADLATEKHREYRQGLEVLAAEIAAMGSAVDIAAEAVGQLRVEVAKVEEFATANEFTIQGGVVVGGPEGVSGFDRAFMQAELTDKVGAVLTAAERIDDDLASVIAKILARQITDGGSATLADAAAQGSLQGDNQLHDDLRAKYQVSPDPNGMTLWPSGVTGWMWEQLGNKKNPVTATEAAMLDDLQAKQGVLGLKEFADIRQDALSRGENVFEGKGGTDGHADAFRHAYWNARMTQEYGEDWAKEFATSHERNPSSHPTPVAMDLHNNEVGRRIAVEHPDASPDELAGLIEQAVRDGDMVVVGTDDKLERSDQIEFGQTRATGPSNNWPTDNPERTGHTTPEDPSAYPERDY